MLLILILFAIPISNCLIPNFSPESYCSFLIYPIHNYLTAPTAYPLPTHPYICYTMRHLIIGLGDVVGEGRARARAEYQTQESA